MGLHEPKIDRYETLINEVAKRQPKTILEVGTHMGNSAIAMVNKAREYNNDVFQFIPNLLLFVGIGVSGYLLITYLIDFKTRSLFSSIIGEIIKRKK